MTTNLCFWQCRLEDLDNCYQLEKASYPPDEAASPDRLQYRQEKATPFFRCAAKSDSNDTNNALIGYICGTRCNVFTHSAMGTHEPDGALLAIHSVVVAEPYRRHGFATEMMRDYIKNVKAMADRPKKIVLIAKSRLLGFYVCCGFQVVRPSSIAHGAELWFEVEMDLRPPAMIIDAFADPTQIATGNPAAVVYLNDEQCTDQDWMQKVASEFNLSETAFVWPIEGNNTYAIRYFTPTMEVPLCGHATLASAAALASSEDITFCARNDVLKARLLTTVSGNGRRIMMSFPRMSVTAIETETDMLAVHGALMTGLGVLPIQVMFIGLATGLNDLFVEITEEAFESIGFENDIDPMAFSSIDCYSRGVIICCCNSSTDGVDFRSRFFAPKSGIPEDPVTGSAHCALAPYFANKLGKESLFGRQCSKRGGVVECSIADSVVNITGFARNAVEGSLNM